MPISKNQEVRNLVSEGEYKKALQICKDWDYANPEHREILRRGYECHLYPLFYNQLGYDTTSEYLKAVDVLIEVYGSSEAL